MTLRVTGGTGGHDFEIVEPEAAKSSSGSTGGHDFGIADYESTHYESSGVEHHIWRYSRWKVGLP